MENHSLCAMEKTAGTVVLSAFRHRVLDGVSSFSRMYEVCVNTEGVTRRRCKLAVDIEGSWTT